MIFDVERANFLLNSCGTRLPDNRGMVTDKNVLFEELNCIHLNDLYDSPNDDIDEEVCDFTNYIQYEMSDLNFCLVYDEDNWTDNPITLYVSLKVDESYDQHMEVPFIDEDVDWTNVMEQAWEYEGDKDIDTLRKELEAAGGTWSEKLKSYFVE